LDFALHEKSADQRNLKEYFEKLISLGN